MSRDGEVTPERRQTHKRPTVICLSNHLVSVAPLKDVTSTPGRPMVQVVDEWTKHHIPLSSTRWCPMERPAVYDHPIVLESNFIETQTVYHLLALKPIFLAVGSLSSQGSIDGAWQAVGDFFGPEDRHAQAEIILSRPCLGPYIIIRTGGREPVQRADCQLGLRGNAFETVSTEEREVWLEDRCFWYKENPRSFLDVPRSNQSQTSSSYVLRIDIGDLYTSRSCPDRERLVLLIHLSYSSAARCSTTLSSDSHGDFPGRYVP